MAERITRVTCRTCEGDGAVWAPKMAVPWGSREATSLHAPTRCRECRGEGGFDLIEAVPDRPDRAEG